MAEQQRQAAEQALSEAQQQALFTLEALPVMVWTAQPDGSIDYVYQRWLDFTGHSPAQDAGQNWHDAMHPDDLPRLIKGWEQAVANHSVYEVEFRMRRHDGQYRWVFARTVPQQQANGSVRMWVGSGMDMHAQKQLVQELAEANEQQLVPSDQAYQVAQLAQQQRETFYRLFMQAPAMVVFMRSPQCLFEFVNPAYQQLKPQEQMVGRTVAEVFPESAEQGFLATLDGVYQTVSEEFGLPPMMTPVTF